MIYRSDTARKIFFAGAIKLEPTQLKLHDTNPSDPLSPIYLNFRRPPKGQVGDQLVYDLGKLLYAVARMEPLSYDGVAGVPEAGGPLTEAFSSISGVPQIWLEKTEGATPSKVWRRTKGRGGEIGRVLLIDDVVSGAHSKMKYVETLRSSGFEVKDVLVLVDREQSGGRDVLIQAGLNLLAVWQISELLGLYRIENIITEEKYQEVRGYLRANQ